MDIEKLFADTRPPIAEKLIQRLYKQYPIKTYGFGFDVILLNTSDPQDSKYAVYEGFPPGYWPDTATDKLPLARGTLPEVLSWLKAHIKD